MSLVFAIGFGVVLRVFLLVFVGVLLVLFLVELERSWRVAVSCEVVLGLVRGGGLWVVWLGVCCR